MGASASTIATPGETPASGSSEASNSGSSQSHEKQFADELARLRGLVSRARFERFLVPDVAIGDLAKAVDGLIDLVEANVAARAGDAVVPVRADSPAVEAQAGAVGVHEVAASTDAVDVTATENAAASADAVGAKTSGDDIEGASESESDSDSDSPLDASGHLPWGDGDHHERTTARMWDDVVKGSVVIEGARAEAVAAATAEYDRAYAELVSNGKDSAEIETVLGVRPRVDRLPVKKLAQTGSVFVATGSACPDAAELFERTRSCYYKGGSANPDDDLLENFTPQSHARFAAPVIVDQLDAARIAKETHDARTPEPLTENVVAPRKEKPKKKRSKSPRLDRDGYLPWDESDYHERMVDDMWTREMLDRVDAAAEYDIDAKALRAKGVSEAGIEGRLGRRPKVTKDEIARAAELRSGPNKAAYALNSKNDIEDAPNRPAARGAEKRAELAKKNTDDDAAMMRLLMSTPLTAQSTSAGKRADSVSLEDDDLLEDPWNSEDEGQRRWDDEF